VFKEVSKLSGGERSRLELALLGIMPSNLLLLDEPTNHLDIPAREAIESFMHDSPATLLVVSHDRRLLETVCTTLWVVDDGLAVPFAGGWKDWRAAVADGWTVHAAAERETQRLRGGAHGGSRLTTVAGDRGSGSRPAGPSASTAVAEPIRSPGPTGSPSASRRPGVRREKLSKDAYRRQKAQVDADLNRLGLRKSQLELSMGSPAIAANFVEMRRVASELADVEQALAAAEDAWLDLEERAP
jgi:energy-coupling factor transporter ATP-binding protein EcfA2